MAKITQPKTLFFLLLFICLLINFSPFNGKLVTNMQVHHKQSTLTDTDTTTTMTTTTVGTGGTGTPSRKYYGEALHEVPSGANPESNK
ncbi:hypothetical protein EJD97_015693 [Solanum chilense]|uniref:Uncharacterized protein n=1 Tax=Solanum chilense TaxID=4083 RepID=A0A6N2C9X4_SOLCI|nr:hypothetical protein EJD97_015693 [Solanum chilense]